MAPLQVIYDCDPGKDDAFALFLALACPDVLSVVAVTTVEGNVPVAFTAANARRIVQAAGRADIPVYRGCGRPILRPVDRKEQVQGAGGLDDSGLPEANGPERTEHAVTALITMLEAAARPLTIAAIGPLTNIAMLLVARPDLADRIENLFIMGGSEGSGNMGDAEYNFLLDPHAAASVFASGISAILVTLDHTRDLRPSMSWFEAMEGFGAPGKALAAMWRVAPVALYDVAVTALLLWPDLFRTEACSVTVEICDSQRMGQTRIVRGQGSCRIVTGLDTDIFYDRIVATMAFYGERPIT